MFGLKKFAKIKKENFAKDKDRKRYFAIKPCRNANCEQIIYKLLTQPSHIAGMIKGKGRDFL